MKILVSGAGIAGNAVAFWLSKLGHEVTVVEWFNTLRATGLQVDLRGHAVEVLKRMGDSTYSAFRESSVDERGMEVVDWSGKRRGFFPVNRTGQGVQDFSTEHEIMRGDLCKIIHDTTATRATYRFGTSIQRIHETGSGLCVAFKDGQVQQFDLLIGADGQASRTRALMLGPDKDDGLIPLPLSMAYFTTVRPISTSEHQIATWYLAPGKRFIMTRRHSAECTQVYLAAADESRSERLMNARRGDVREEKAAMSEIFRDAGWQSNQLVEAMADSTDFYLERLGVVKLNSWSNGRIVLVGDAAYCPSAMTGMGTTSAMLGAYILAGEIGSSHIQTTATIQAALKRYEEKFRPFMDQVQQGVAENESMSVPSSRLGLTFVYWLVDLVSLLRLNVVGRWFLKEKVDNWSLPEYSEMVNSTHKA